MTAVEIADPITTHVTRHDYKMLIGGKFVDSSDGGVLAVTNPSTGERITEIPSASAGDIDRPGKRWASTGAVPAWRSSASWYEKIVSGWRCWTP